MSPRRPVTLIGAGRVGLVLARALQTSSTFRVTAVWDPSAVARERAHQELGDHVDLPSDPDTAVRQADTVVIAVPDDHLHDVARTLGAHGDWTSTLAVHTSGRYGTEAILPLGVAGADLAAVHPAMTFPGSLEVETERIRHAHFAVTAGSARAGERAAALVRAMGGTPFPVEQAQRALYHAALTHGMNHLVTLMVDAMTLLGRAGVEDPHAVLRPLLTAAMENALADGAQALTGPVTRGDIGTVSGHLDAVEVAAPAMTPTYRALALRTTDLAESTQRIRPDVATHLRALLTS